MKRSPIVMACWLLAIYLCGESQALAQRPAVPNSQFHGKIVASLEQFCNSAKGQVIQVTALGDQSDSLQEGKIWGVETRAVIATNSDETSRHVAVSITMSLNGVIQSVQEQSNRFANDQGALNYNIRKVVHATDRERHQIVGKLKSFDSRDLWYWQTGYLIGVCEIAERTFLDLFDGSSYLTREDIEKDRIHIRFSLGNDFDCEYVFRRSDFRIHELRVTQLEPDVVTSTRQRDGAPKDADRQRRQPKSIVTLSNLSYSADNEVDSLTFEHIGFGNDGSRWKSFAQIKATCREPLGNRPVPELLPPSVSWDHPRSIFIEDDPHIRYKLDPQGKLRKAIDTRAFEKIFGTGDEGDRAQLERPTSHQTNQALINELDRYLIPDPYLRSDESRAHCGLYCVMAALDALSVPYSPSSLLDSRFISSRMGSSAEELINALAENGTPAVLAKNLTIHSVRRSKYPIILHLEKGPGEPTQHWVLFLKDDGGRAQILDAPRIQEIVDYKTLLSKWNGRGIVVGTSSLPTAWYGGAIIDKIRLLFVPAILVGFICVFQPLTDLLPSKMFGSLSSAVAILFLTIGFSWIFHNTSRQGLAKHPSAFLSVSPSKPNRHQFQEISKDNLIDLIRHKKVVIVDARIPASFRLGHIPGALNFPVDASLGELEASVLNLKSKVLTVDNPKIVIYCQSEYCEWDSIVASSIRRMGFKNIFIFQPGWEGWSQIREPGNTL